MTHIFIAQPFSEQCVFSSNEQLSDFGQNLATYKQAWFCPLQLFLKERVIHAWKCCLGGQLQSMQMSKFSFQNTREWENVFQKMLMHSWRWNCPFIGTLWNNEMRPCVTSTQTSKSSQDVVSESPCCSPEVCLQQKPAHSHLIFK